MKRFFQRPKAAPKMLLAGLSVKGSIEMHGERLIAIFLTQKRYSVKGVLLLEQGNF